MQQLMQWLSNLFGPKDELVMTRMALALLGELRGELNKIADRLNHKQTDGVEEITGFFGAIAQVQDSYLVRSAINELKASDQLPVLAKDLERLNLHILNAGRNEYGWNRTTIGQPVTDEDVYLGNIGGYFTKSVAYIKAHRDDQAFYATVNAQAIAFMNSHIGPMVQIVNGFERVMSAKAA